MAEIKDEGMRVIGNLTQLHLDLKMSLRRETSDMEEKAVKRLLQCLTILRIEEPRVRQIVDILVEQMPEVEYLFNKWNE